MWCFLFVTKEGSLLHKQIYNMHDLILCVSAREYDSQNTQSHRTTVYVCETLISVVSIGKCCIQVYKTYISRSCRPVYLHDLSLFSVSKFRLEIVTRCITIVVCANYIADYAPLVLM